MAALFEVRDTLFNLTLEYGQNVELGQPYDISNVSERQTQLILIALENVA